VPTYEYACTVCAERTEAVQSFTDPPLTECPACGGRLRKVFSPVGVVFKGSGFYKNDSRGKPAKTPAASDASSSTGSSGAFSGSAGSSSGSADSSGSSSGAAPAAKPATPSSTGSGTPAAR
jgi:putative FmdB family regulatory protein